MNGGILDENLLSNNIEQIIYYTSEEKNNLTKICNKLSEFKNNYNSLNLKTFENNIESLRNSITLITKKRIKYTTVLKKVIIRYNNLSQLTKIKFDR